LTYKVGFSHLSWTKEKKRFFNLDFLERFKDAEVLVTTPARISSLAPSDIGPAQGQAIEAYFKEISTLQEKLGKTLIIFVDEVHTLSKNQVENLGTTIKHSINVTTEYRIDLYLVQSIVIFTSELV